MFLLVTLVNNDKNLSIYVIKSKFFLYVVNILVYFVIFENILFIFKKIQKK